MADYLSAIFLAYTLLKDTIKIALHRPEIVKRKDFQEKIKFIQRSMIEIINNGQTIFDLIRRSKTADAGSRRDIIRDIKVLAKSQIGAIEQLRRALGDNTWSRMFELLMPDLRGRFHDPMFLKGERLHLLLIIDDLEYDELVNLYREEYFKEGQEILDKLRQTSVEVAQIIRAKIPVEDL